MPTWFTVRANASGWTARRRDAGVLVAMNVESIAEDIASLRPGAILVITKSLASHVTRDDLKVYVVPFDELVVPVCKDARLRKMVVNILYVGVLAHLLDIEMDEVKKAIAKQFAKKGSAAKLNTEAAIAGYEWAREHLPKQNEFTLKRAKLTEGQIIIEGNQAAGLGLMFGGVTVLAWYPITPSSSLCEACIDYLEEYRHDPETGKATYAVIQAEDRARLDRHGRRRGVGRREGRDSHRRSRHFLDERDRRPRVLRGDPGRHHRRTAQLGPSTGLPTRTCQRDIWKAYNLSHGDCKHPMLLPGNMAECFEFAAESLNLAERLQTLVFVMTDLDLGMNSWMSAPFAPITKPIDRGKVLSDEDLAKVGEFARYKDIDGDGICYRTLPGSSHPNSAYFTRGTGHTEAATYSEKPGDWAGNLDRLTKKFDTARNLVPKPIVKTTPGATIGIIAFGSSDPAVEEARVMLTTEEDTKTDYLRLRALPIGPEVREFIDRHPAVYVVEQNRDAQCASILRLECPDRAPLIRSILHYNGLPIDAHSIVEGILAGEKKGRNPS